jgi:hypothetical protein
MKYARLSEVNIMSPVFLSYGESRFFKDMKVEGELFKKRKETREWGSEGELERVMKGNI